MGSGIYLSRFLRVFVPTSATFAPLGITLRNTRLHSTSFERIRVFPKNR